MNFEEIYIKFKEQEHIQPIKLHNKKKYYTDLSNLEDSWTVRVDAWLSNTFIQEAIRLIINAIVLFEKGYLDCAYYSLRQSLEVSTTMVYLIELDEEKKETELSKWRRKSKFPMYGQMIAFLTDNEKNFADMKNEMSEYFNELQKLKNRLNKHVHKQGFNTFYVSRNHMISIRNDRTDMTLEFEECLKGCIGSIAIFRLAIDPFPILLMDYEIYARTSDLLTEAFSYEFVQFYIGEEAIESYKNTEIYQELYEEIMKDEKRLPSVVDVVKNKFIDIENIEEILSQVHLLSKIDSLAVIVTGFSKKISRIYANNGLSFYLTSNKSVREKIDFNGEMFLKIRASDVQVNISFDEAYLTYLNICNEDFFLEHNKQLELKEFDTLIDKINIVCRTMNLN
ncbi:teicoplanin resistance protein VanZ [Paenibacillus barcinonensis]|uniref:Teicoplanin resistance protein VanZ n=1 Tax=Paenibacillus barcinonensis TaxID=198119 RepID=A0A2V4VB87_PAEBA|nr:teicoplanin resistance protein VanZ [Paenibacillus barcinonensis]PYE43291.1 hypothetical protein DFQ00_12952 [Paenibacillus barcinonensis]QKS55578.1 teicoplanin resistance protein VanZ [Paenibacillus barcinonensis]